MMIKFVQKGRSCPSLEVVGFKVLLELKFPFSAGFPR